MNQGKMDFVKYPRKELLRLFFRFLGKALLKLFARPIISGRENLPVTGPVILAGNHVAVLEIVLMAVYSRKIVEFLGAGDIPLDPNLAWLANLYGFIPIRRGSLDRMAIKKALSVLRQGGIIGVFPQGGIWETSVDQARVGAAFLSILGRAPVTPIGFGGMKGALKMMIRLERPRLVMNVGKALDLPELQGNKSISKEALEAYAQEILGSIVELLSEEERPTSRRPLGEGFSVDVNLIQIETGDQIISSCDLTDDERTALGRFFHYPILLDALGRNLGLKVQALQRFDQPMSPTDLVAACQEILDYLEINPGFFSYRLGIDTGLQIKSAIENLISICRTNSGNLICIEIVPIYRYREISSGELIEERGAPKIHSM